MEQLTSLPVNTECLHKINIFYGLKTINNLNMERLSSSSAAPHQERSVWSSSFGLDPSLLAENVWESVRFASDSSSSAGDDVTEQLTSGLV